jgi:post-segregation antitoxin (ccd killing protein)
MARTQRAVTPKRKRIEKGARKASPRLSLRIDTVELRSAEQQQWLTENDKAIEYYNSFVAKNGVFGKVAGS